ncbi:hypothetical protein [Methanocaldococcus sp.]
MEKVKIEIETLSKTILNNIKKVDELIESTYSNGYYNIHGFPFIYDIYLEIKNRHIDYNSSRPRIMFNLYNLYPLSFIELPIVRGVRTRLNKDLSSSIVSIKKLQTGRRDSDIYKKYPGTLITYGKVDIVENLNLPFILKYFPYLYSKPLLYIEDIKTNKHLWHLNCIVPNVTSFLSISNEIGEVEYLMPFSGAVFLDYSNKKISKRKVFGHKMKCLELFGHLLFINRKTLNVRYFGPFPIVVPKTSLTDDTLININSDILITNAQGFINFRDKGYLLNNIKIESGYILILNELPYIPELYSLANFGSIHLDNINLPMGNIKIPKIIIDIKKIIKINRNINNAINFYMKKRNSYGKSISNNINNCNYLISKEITKYIHKDSTKLWMYHPTLISYSSFGGISIAEIKKLMKLNNFTRNLKNIQYILSNLNQSFRLYQKIIDIERNIIRNYKLWLGI